MKRISKLGKIGVAALVIGMNLGGIINDVPVVNAAENVIAEDCVPDLDTELSYMDLQKLNFSSDKYTERYLRINSDGSFEGGNYYPVQQMPDNSAVCYYDEYKGKFGKLERVNEYVYVMTLESAESVAADREPFVKDGVTYEYTEGRDLRNNKRLYLYLPGTPKELMPLYYRYDEDIQTDVLDRYAICNVIDQATWYSDRVDEAKWVIPHQALSREQAKKEIAIYEDEIAEYHKLFEEVYPTQFLINMVASRTYDIWQVELERICHSLEVNMTEKDWKKFSKEQAKWQKKCDEAMDAERKMWEGGSGAGAAVAGAGISCTEPRVKEVVELLY